MGAVATNYKEQIEKLMLIRESYLTLKLLKVYQLFQLLLLKIEIDIR